MDYCTNDLINAFGTLITNDKDNLVSQMLDFLNNTNLDRDSAMFYLDMTNWNIQQAIDLFYSNDCQLVQNHLSQCDASELSCASFLQIRPNIKFTKTFQIKNTGAQIFPPNSKFRIVSGADILLVKNNKIINLPCLDVGSVANVPIELKSPGKVGLYETNWRVYNEGYYFGDKITVRLEVIEEGGLLDEAGEASASHRLETQNQNREQEHQSSTDQDMN